MRISKNRRMANPSYNSFHGTHFLVPITALSFCDIMHCTLPRHLHINIKRHYFKFLDIRSWKSEQVSANFWILCFWKHIPPHHLIWHLQHISVGPSWSSALERSEESSLKSAPSTDLPPTRIHAPYSMLALHVYFKIFSFPYLHHNSLRYTLCCTPCYACIKVYLKFCYSNSYHSSLCHTIQIFTR